MVFSSLTFLCIFLPAVFGLYLLVPGIRAKNVLLVVFSFLFYAYGEPVYVLLMLASTLCNYLFGLWIEWRGGRFRKAALLTAVLFNLGLLGVFKYTDMVIGSVNALLQTEFALTGIELPIGISFYTFQALSYVIDVYRGEVKAQKNYLHIALYISLFPQLIAGPIVKYHDVEAQITDRHPSRGTVAAGLRRFIAGLSKKVLIANTMAVAADALYVLPADQLNTLSAWTAAGAYMLQIYFDFSGYSDMAIGLGHMFGFTFPENFNYPYSARSMQDFWRRWHISLTTWFREYLYIPLGGNRRGRLRTSINRLVVFFCTGLWHGPAWTFVIWGLYNGGFLLLEGAVPRLQKLPRLTGHAYTLLAVLTGFIFFRAETLSQGASMIAQLFTAGNWSVRAVGYVFEQLSPTFITALVAGIILSAPVLRIVGAWAGRRPQRARALTAASYPLSILLLLVCMMTLSSGTYNPFIYFRF
ncbi:MAG: MBOAT family protein [Clostridia bacterium]|nr:MBOAT family protein [Clostridia bacterium]